MLSLLIYILDQEGQSTSQSHPALWGKASVGAKVRNEPDTIPGVQNKQINGKRRENLGKPCRKVLGKGLVFS